MQQIDYMIPQAGRRGWWMRCWRWAFLVIAALLLISILISGKVATENGWTCSVCGSSHGEIEWIGGFKSGQSFNTSALDTWISQNSGGHQHQWYRIRGTSRNIFGFRIGSAHGLAPVNYRFGNDLQPYYIQTSTPEQIRAFVQILQTGTDAQKQEAVKRAINQSLVAMKNLRTK